MRGACSQLYGVAVLSHWHGAVAAPQRGAVAAPHPQRDVVVDPNLGVAGRREAVQIVAVRLGAGLVSLQCHRHVDGGHPAVVIDGVLDDPVRLGSVEADCQYSTSRAPDRLQKHMSTLHCGALMVSVKTFPP